MSSNSRKKIMTQEKSDTPEQPEALMYCGPNLPKGILNQFTVYRSGLPKHLDEHLKSCPAIARLFVPVERMTATMQLIGTAGTSENVWFEQVVQFSRGGAK